MLTRSSLLALALLALASVGHAATERKAKIGPASGGLSAYNNTAIDSSQIITIASSTARNCLKKLSFVANSTATVRVLDGGTTVYAIDLGTSTILSEVWDDEDMCGSAGALMYIKVSTASRQATVGAQSVNYAGFTY